MVKLKRSLGLFETTMAGIGIILGAGIYALIGQAASLAGNTIWISFVIGGIVASLTALSYAELSSIFPLAGAEYVYTEKSFGKRLGFLVGWLITIGTISAAATVSLGFGGYLTKFFDFPVVISAVLLIIVMSLLNFYGIKESAITAIVCTIVEALGLIIIIFIGGPYLGKVNYFEIPPDGIIGIFNGAALVFFAFLGFESITRLSEETKNPEKTIPAATLISLWFSTIIYILVALVAISVIPWQKLALSSAPLADVAHVGIGENTSIVLAIVALFATANTVLLMLVSDTRIIYSMAQSKIFPRKLRLGEVHKKRRTPWIAAALVGAISIAFVFIGDIKYVANTTDFTVFVTFAIINLAVIWLRYTKPNIKRPFKIPTIGKFPITAAMGAASSILLATNVGKDVIIGGIIIITLGLIFYELIKKEE